MTTIQDIMTSLKENQKTREKEKIGDAEARASEKKEFMKQIADMIGQI